MQYLLSKDGDTKITTHTEKLKRWGEYFENTTNIKSTLDESSFKDLDLYNLHLNDDFSVPLSVSGIEIAIKQSKRGSATGIEEISTEANNSAYYKKRKQVWLRQLPRYCRSLCSKQDFKRAILNRLKPILDKYLSEDQCGFGANRGCCDQIFNARIIMQRARKFNVSTYFCFIDLHKAYDSVNRNALWKVLQKSYKLPVKMITIIQSLHDGTNGVVRFEGQVSSEIPIESGVKQGDVMAPLLFNLFLNTVTKIALSKAPQIGVHMRHNTSAPSMKNNNFKLDNNIIIQNLIYADDMVLISHNIEELRYLVDLVADEFKKFGLKIKMAKTKFMKVSASSALCDPVILKNIEQVRVSISGLHAFRRWENRLRNRIMSIKSIPRLQVSPQTGMVPTKNKKQHQNKVVQRYGASSSAIWLWILGASEPSHSAITEVRNTMFANNLHFSLKKIEKYKNKKNSKHRKRWNNDSTKKIEVARTRRKNARKPSTQNITGEQNSWW